MASAKNMLEHVLQASNTHNLDLTSAKSLATVSEQFLDDLRNSHRTSAADSLWVEALDVEADLQTNSGDDKEALELATKAREAALGLAEANPPTPKQLHLLYGATIRVGNALAAPTIKRFDDARGEYGEAVGIAQKIVSLSDNETAEADLVDSQIKIGDIHQIRKQYSDALEGYRAGLSTCETALVKFPQSLNLLRNQGKAYYRMAESLKQQNERDEARTAYQKALEIQQTLVQRDRNDPTLESNLAATYTHWGALDRDAGDLSLALSKFEKGVALQEELQQSDPTNPQWEIYLSPNYVAVADILEKLNRPKDALIYYQRAFDVRRDLAIRALGNPDWQEKFADAAKALGDRSVGLAQIDAFRAPARTWKRLLESPSSASVAARRFDDVIGFAHAFDAARDWPDAQTAYGVAEKIALWNIAKDPSDTTWKDKAQTAAEGAAASTTSFETSTATPPQ
jgi:tetratricopeptide (TPR) repeat protein